MSDDLEDRARAGIDERRADLVRDIERLIHRDPEKRRRWLDRVEADRIRMLKKNMGPRRRGWIARKLFGI